jgi:hypothetical protein
LFVGSTGVSLPACILSMERDWISTDFVSTLNGQWPLETEKQ